MIKLFKHLLLGIVALRLQAQQISMNFPKFSGKSYDFIIFQGSEQKTVFQGIIPEGGKFILSIPKEYIPYKGMGRWLITGTKEGGGLDMYIPGQDFSVSCNSGIPNNTNIIYKDNIGNTELNELFKMQEKILTRYQVMLQAVNIFTTKDANYSVFQSEYNKQKKDYDKFQELLTKRDDYIGEIIRIVNITQGIGTKLYDKEVQKAENISFYVSHQLDWNMLYTSGYWWSVLNGWVSIHTQVLKDKNMFLKEFEMIGSKLKDKHQYTDFVSKVTYFLKESNNEDYLKAIA
ncbi:alkyl hydroperoxide reductase [Elizabethkingia anophelis]|uniref:alkyl hydroperoxide reductase n=1 Tax=Elizabethkingia anophelis TaxID=1117645 RepID=UPI00201167D4|nr:alkyl hydroperoxide reductase [Elizabethkingia anophelis]MCL1643654.1 alkyl hydroperoxide reductase [Elizabethkingia anophelis]MCL1647310.1 alkyl hydroperoxide reductase [Elizabethkingia anophelis]WBS72174.1 alkyl hydroperoxide reductase [Elizabethkingia anophelis]